MILAQKTKKDQHSVDSLNKLIADQTDQEQYLKSNTMAYDELMMRISKLDVEKANKTYDIQVITAKVYDDGLTHMTDYYDKALYQKFTRLTDGITKNRNQKTTLLTRIDSLSNLVYLINYKYHSARVSRVSPSDFLYFSIITATTTGYGDILPNTSLIRMLVSLEVINMVIFVFKKTFTEFRALLNQFISGIMIISALRLLHE